MKRSRVTILCLSVLTIALVVAVCYEYDALKTERESNAQYAAEAEQVCKEKEALEIELTNQEQKLINAEIELNQRIREVSVVPFYTLFYGEWQIEEFIEGTRYERYETDIIGEKISFSRHAIYMGKDLILEDPAYEIQIIPMASWYDYCKPNAPYEPERVFSTDSQYFAHVFISNDLDVEYWWFCNFYIKDANTIIFDGMVHGRQGLYKATRIDSLDDWKLYIEEAR